MCSFSKIAGFTGTRCGYTVVPQALAGGKLNKMWLRRQTTKFNGVAYVVQRGAEAVFTDEGMKEIQQNLDYYRATPLSLRRRWTRPVSGTAAARTAPTSGCAAPTRWAVGSFLTGCSSTPTLWAPPVSFGPCGKGYFRLTAFGDAERTKEAAARIKAALATL